MKFRFGFFLCAAQNVPVLSKRGRFQKVRETGMEHGGANQRLHGRILRRAAAARKILQNAVGLFFADARQIGFGKFRFPKQGGSGSKLPEYLPAVWIRRGEQAREESHCGARCGLLQKAAASRRYVRYPLY